MAIICLIPRIVLLDEMWVILPTTVNVKGIFVRSIFVCNWI